MYLNKLSQTSIVSSSSLNYLAKHNIVFNLYGDEGLVCDAKLDVAEHSSKSESISDESFEEKLVVTGEALNLEKLFRLQEDLQAHLSFGQWQILTSRTCKQWVAKCFVHVAVSEGVSRFIESLATKHCVELALVNNPPKLHQKGLLVMDMDSTVIEIECIDEIAKLAGVGQQVSEVTELAMQGKLDFAESLTNRVACLENAEESILKQVRAKLPLMPGIQSLISILQDNGWKIAIASGGFTYFADYLKERLGLDYAISNTLKIENGKLAGRVEGAIVDAQTKAQTVSKLAADFEIEESQTIALGDGANDLVMMAQAALGVAYKAKPLVREKADTAIRFGNLDTFIDYLD